MKNHRKIATVCSTLLWMTVVSFSILLAELSTATTVAQTSDTAKSYPLHSLQQDSETIPVAFDVDVLVIGGGTAHVAAAVEAQKNGAKTLLITPLPYLGDDLTGTLEIWTPLDEEVTEPLAVSLVNDTFRRVSTPSRLTAVQAKSKLPLSYTIVEPIDKKHGESPQKNRLTDGIIEDPSHNSVQVNSDMTVHMDFGKKQSVEVVSVMPFYRADDFAVESVVVAASDDGKSWRAIGTVKLADNTGRIADSVDEFRLTLPAPVSTQFLKLEIKKTAASNRVLMSEIVVLADKNDLVVPTTTSNNVKESSGGESAKTLCRPSPRPLHVKQTLDAALLEANVPFLFGVYESGSFNVKNISGTTEEKTADGVIIHNRSGKQAILAKQVIRDLPIVAATVSEKTSTVGKSASGNSGNSADTTYFARFVVVGGEPFRGDWDKERYNLLQHITVQEMGEPYFGPWPNRAKTSSDQFPLWCYTITIAPDVATAWLSGNTDVKNRLESQIRNVIYHPEQQFTADLIAVRPTQSSLKTLDQRIQFGKEQGRLAATRATKSTLVRNSVLTAENVMLKNGDSTGSSPAVRSVVSLGKVMEQLGNVKPFRPPLATLKLPQTEIPIAGEYDVVVIGGGTTGTPAGIAAARQGAKTLVLEYLHNLGGIGTEGAIASYYYGNRVGFCQEVDGDNRAWVIEQKMQWWRSALEKAGSDVWYGVLGTGAVVDSSTGGLPRTRGVVVATADGPRIVLAKIIIDTTGAGDIAVAAGASAVYVDSVEIAVQGAGLPPRELGATGMNTDYMYVDDTDVTDVSHVLVYGKMKFPKAFDFGKILDSRERRQVIGEFSFTPLDQLNKRTYPDTICRSSSNFDTHGYTIDPYFLVEHPDRESYTCDTPFRSSLPKGIESILVGGLATSCHRDALPLIRMQSDLQNQGYALGCIAAAAAKNNQLLRTLNLKPIQEHLVAIGNLPESVLTDTDNYGTPESLAQVPTAVQQMVEGKNTTAFLFWYLKESLPLLQTAYKKAEPEETKLQLAVILAAMDDATGTDTLICAVESFKEFDTGWNFRGMGQFGWSSSPLDRYITLLGRTRNTRGAKVIAEKLMLLTAESDFSHHRACALALEMIGDTSAAPVIAAHLRKPNVAGYSHHDMETAKKWDQSDPKNGTAEKSRRDSLVEIAFARALYRLGDVDGLGKQILRDYSTDLRGYFSRHANEVLSPPPRNH